jgi:DNA polymerase-4
MDDLYERVLSLFRKKYRAGRGVRLIGAGLLNLEAERGGGQQELFGSAQDVEKERRLEEAILEINKKFPQAALRRGRSWLGGGSPDS